MKNFIFALLFFSTQASATCSEAYRMFQNRDLHKTMALGRPGKLFNQGEVLYTDGIGLGDREPHQLQSALEASKNGTPSRYQLELLEKIEKKYFRGVRDHELLRVVRKKQKHPLKKMARYKILRPYHERVIAILKRAFIDETFCAKVILKNEEVEKQSVFLEETIVQYVLTNLPSELERNPIPETHDEAIKPWLETLERKMKRGRHPDGLSSRN